MAGIDCNMKLKNEDSQSIRLSAHHRKSKIIEDFYFNLRYYKKYREVMKKKEKFEKYQKQ